MDAPNPLRLDLAAKIARLVEERGWNQEDFARIANLNRHTVREIIRNGQDRRLRNATISQCAAALGLHVNELRDLPLERLLPRMHGKPGAEGQGGWKVLRERGSTELIAWLEARPERAAQITPDEALDLLAMQGVGGALSRLGVEHCLEQIERKRRLIRRVAVVAGSDYGDLLEQFVGVLFDRVQSGK